MARRWVRVFSPADLGGLLARLRAERGLTQADLAGELGISRRYLYEIETAYYGAGEPVFRGVLSRCSVGC